MNKKNNDKNRGSQKKPVINGELQAAIVYTIIPLVALTAAIIIKK